ncbi:MAG: DUF1579 domain-containing protein [Fimbriimonadaceae bacterium]|nr:DUF1579 family protein [Chthonomonadaceae bacterium]MCO5295842.1 DUF1579 domain-containing protein [Fimbriimonadaceae bacterium]
MTRWTLAATLLLVCALANSQVPDMGPAPELKKFEWMVGNWSGTMKMSMEGMEMEGKMTHHAEWSGPFLRGTSKWEMEGFTMNEEFFMGWDPEKGKYSSYTFTNLAPTPRIEWGVAQGDTVVFTSEPWKTDPNGEATVSRASMTKLSDTELKFVLEFKAGDDWVKAGEAIFKKQ